MGKTQLVREYIYTHQADLTSVIWIHAQSLQTLQASFLGFAQQLIQVYASKAVSTCPSYARIARHLNMVGLVDQNGHVAFDQNAREVAVTAVGEWLGRDCNNGWLLIFDNVDDLESFNISDYFPNPRTGCIILTSRRTESARLGKEMKLDVMEEEESIALLSRSISKDISIGSDDYGDARLIVKELGYLPLAIDQAGAYLHKLSKPLSAFLPLFKANFKTTLCKRPPSAVWQYGEKTVLTTWEISFKAIEAENPQAAELLVLCSFLANDGIDTDFLYCGLTHIFNSTAHVDDTVSTLISFSLAARKKNSNNFSIHPLVHSWARERLTPEKSREMVVKALRVISSAVDEGRGEGMRHSWAVSRQTLPHIEKCSNSIQSVLLSDPNDPHHELAKEWSNLAWVYSYQGRYSEAEAMYQRALAGREKVLGPGHLSTLQLVANLGKLCHDRGKLDEAESLLRRALAGYEGVLDPDHASRLVVVQNLGMLYHARGKLDEAETMLQRALSGHEKTLGSGHVATLTVFQNLAMLYYDRGKLNEAEAMFLQALSGYEKALDPDHTSILAVVQNLGMLYHDRGRLDQAEAMLQRALAGYEKVLGPEHTSIFLVVQNLGMLRLHRGMLNGAEAMFRRALSGYEKVLDPDHTSILVVVQNLGMLYHARGKLDEAGAMLERALAGYEKVLEPDHASKLVVEQNLGTLYHSRGKFAEAEAMWQRALAGYKRTLEPNHTSILLVMQNLGALYYDRGQLDEAEAMLQRALAGYEKVLEPEHTSLLLVVLNLGSLNHRRGKLDEAEAMLQRVLAGYEKVFAPDHMLTLSVVRNLGILYLDCGRLGEAEAMFRRAFTGYGKVFGPVHKSTLAVAQRLGILYVKQTRFTEAEEMYQSLLAEMEKTIGPDHQLTLGVVYTLGRVYVKQGKLTGAETMYKRALTNPNHHLVCGACGESVPSVAVHNHCAICHDGDFDVCQNCINKGVLCRGRGHRLIKRRNEGGKFVELPA